jgi:hypothetical protein
MAANTVRGEVALAAGGRTWVFRPTFAALVAAEAELGSLWALIDRAAGGDVRMGEAVALLWHCLGGEATRDAFGEAVLEAGLAALTPALHTLFRQILAGR